MYRFLVVVWNYANSAQTAAARAISLRTKVSIQQWHEAMSEPGLLVLYSGASLPTADYHPIANDAGVVLGKLFKTTSTGPYPIVPGAISGAEAEKIVKSEGRHLFTHYWGRYVAVIREPSTARTFVLRDPTGALPCCFTTYKGVHVLFSDAADCSRLALQPYSIDWKMINALVTGIARPQTGNTAISEISDLRAGECLTIAPDSATRRFHWNPLQIAQTDVIENPAHAAVELRRTVRACVHAWADCFPKIIHSLSGGLDSAIVLSALTDAPSRPTITPVNYYTSSPEGDERHFARYAAGLAKLNLIERKVEGNNVDLKHLLNIKIDSSPNLACASELLNCEFEKQLSTEIQADAFFQGGGGDGIFLQTGAEHCAADYIRTKGIRWPLVQVAHDAAQITSDSIWKLLQHGFSENWQRQSWNPIANIDFESTFASREAIEQVRSTRKNLIHPFFTCASALPSGKLWHIFMSHVPADYYRPFPEYDRPEMVFPLISQPVHELCLRIPSYVMFHGGVDRATARRAFEREIPLEILRRTSKGQANHVFREILSANLPFIRDFLLGGLLIREGLVNLKKLEPFLSGNLPAGITGLVGCNQIVSMLLGTEAFLRSWDARRSQSIA